ncbi:MAG TPA: endonuclease [Candidatus Moranbacteria bacterium]|nr:endonuclease [Candidatus Moranbacteria bacterium]HAT75104.1 endonuclease [Candidatus Moranbacteria bacterium]
MRIGCHISIAGGIQNAPQRAADLGCECFQIFTRSPQGGKAPELTEEIRKEFNIQNSTFKISAVYIHTPYYINFASANNRIRYGSVSIVRDELERGSILGAKYVLTHIGSAKELGKEDAIIKTIEMLKKTLENYSGSTKLLLENSAGAGKIIGDDLAELKQIIDGVDSKNITGICLDTQHSFASGYDWRDFENTLKRIDHEIGLENIKLIHSNDSLTDCGSKKDRHAHISQGKIGLDAFSKIVKFAEKNNIDMILETEHDGAKEDIEILKKMRK